MTPRPWWFSNVEAARCDAFDGDVGYVPIPTSAQDRPGYRIVGRREAAVARLGYVFRRPVMAKEAQAMHAVLRRGKLELAASLYCASLPAEGQDVPANLKDRDISTYWRIQADRSARVEAMWLAALAYRDRDDLKSLLRDYCGQRRVEDLDPLFGRRYHPAEEFSPKLYRALLRYAYLEALAPGFAREKATKRQADRYGIVTDTFSDLELSGAPSRRDGKHDLRAFFDDDEARSSFHEAFAGDGRDPALWKKGSRRRAHPKRTWYVGGDESSVERVALHRVELWEGLEEARKDADAMLTMRAVVLRIAGYSSVEAAASLGLSAGAVDSRVSRYRKRPDLAATPPEASVEIPTLVAIPVIVAPWRRSPEATTTGLLSRRRVQPMMCERYATEMRRFGALPSRDDPSPHIATEVVPISLDDARKKRTPRPNLSGPYPDDEGDVAA